MASQIDLAELPRDKKSGHGEEARSNLGADDRKRNGKWTEAEGAL